MKHFISTLLVLCTLQTEAADWQDVPALDALFETAGVAGTFVLYDVDAQTLRGHDKERAETRFIPASTFKIANSLIGLSVGAVKSVDDVLPYKGSPDPFIKAWARDMGLREAIAMSNVPIYQELARRIGLQRMQQNVTLMGYGNHTIGDSVDTFWLKGPLKISAIEQVEFLARLTQNALPFPESMQRSVRDIVLLEQAENWKLFGKTGWQNAPGPGVGWWVGWVQKEGHNYIFALNIDVKNAADASKRIALGKASLKTLGVL